MDADKLYLKALEIQDERARGFWAPMMRHLALRGHTDAMVDLAHWYTDGNDPRDLDDISDPYSGANLYYRAWRRSSARAAYSLAIGYFNRGDMRRFRLWAHRGARLGDYSCQIYVKHFETRLPHRTARKVGRLRPEGKRDEWA